MENDDLSVKCHLHATPFYSVLWRFACLFFFLLYFPLKNEDFLFNVQLWFIVLGLF